MWKLFVLGHNSRKPKSLRCLSWQQNRAANLAFLKTVGSRSAPVFRQAHTARAVFQHGRCLFHSGCAFAHPLCSLAPKRCFQWLPQPTAPPARPRAAISVRLALSPTEAGRWNCFHPPATPLDRLIPSLLSCVLLCPAPPVARTRRFNCLAEATPHLRRSRQRQWVQAWPGPTWSTLIRVRRLKHRLT
jgi:hypothetical protein